MQIKVFVEDDLARHPAGRQGLRLLVEFEDRRSRSVEEALDSVWRVTNGAPHLLDEAEQSLRGFWDVRAGGMSLSIGDVVEVDGVRWRCCAEGWSEM